MTAAPELVTTEPPLPRLPACLTRRADGEVVVTGTRVPMADVLAAADRLDLDNLAAAFPRVRPDRLAGVVVFRTAHPEAVDEYTRWRSRRSERSGRASSPASVSNTTSPPPAPLAPPYPDPAE